MTSIESLRPILIATGIIQPDDTLTENTPIFVPLDHTVVPLSEGTTEPMSGTELLLWLEPEFNCDGVTMDHAEAWRTVGDIAASAIEAK